MAFKALLLDWRKAILASYLISVCKQLSWLW